MDLKTAQDEITSDWMKYWNESWRPWSHYSLNGNENIWCNTR